MFCHESGMVLKHVIPITESAELQIVPVEKFLFKVVRVHTSVCIPPNQYEVNL